MSNNPDKFLMTLIRIRIQTSVEQSSVSGLTGPVVEFVMFGFKRIESVLNQH